jgi:hypothetical protein
MSGSLAMSASAPCFGFHQQKLFGSMKQDLEMESETIEMAGKYHEQNQRDYERQMKRMQMRSRPQNFETLFFKGLKTKSGDMYARNAADKQKLSPRRQYVDKIHAGIGMSGIPQPSRIDQPHKHVGSADAFKQTFGIRQTGDNSTRRVAVTMDQMDFHDVAPEHNTRNPPKKLKWSEHHLKLMPKALTPLNLMHYNKNKPQDMEIANLRKSTQLSPRRRYKDEPEGHKNTIASRTVDKKKWVGGKDMNAMFGKRTIPYDSATMKRATYRDQRSDSRMAPPEKLGSSRKAPLKASTSRLMPLAETPEMMKSRKRHEIMQDYEQSRLQLKQLNHSRFTITTPPQEWQSTKPASVRIQHPAGAPLSPRTWQARGEMDRKRVNISTSDSMVGERRVLISTPSMRPLSRGNVTVGTNGKNFDWGEDSVPTAESVPADGGAAAQVLSFN